MPTPTLLWYDYETTGTDVVRDRPLQFAAIRTDMDLVPIGDPDTWYCQPAADVLPHPQACLLTGIAPQAAARDGLIEAEFAARVHELLAEPGTCSAGYNSVRFDDEINRHLFYRNFFDAYEHAWANGNSRWDIMDLARACYALRPAGIEWPAGDDGRPSFKLDRLAPANHLDQQRAHDATSDVAATIGLARLLRQRQPRLYDWHYEARNKRTVAARVAAALASGQPLLHVSGRYAPERGCLAMVLPIAEHPLHKDRWIVADLAVDPEAWALLDPDDLAERMFTSRADLPEDVERPPLKEVQANRSPFVAPIGALKDVDAARIRLDPDACHAHLQRLREVEDLAERVRTVYAAKADAWAPREDPECNLYAGFPSPGDKRRCGQVRATPPTQLGAARLGFDDTRYDELLFRYRARNWPDTLGTDERERWRAFVRNKLTQRTETTTLTLDEYCTTIAALRAESPPGPRQAMLDQLQAWGETVRADFGL